MRRRPRTGYRQIATPRTLGAIGMRLKRSKLPTKKRVPNILAEYEEEKRAQRRGEPLE